MKWVNTAIQLEQRVRPNRIQRAKDRTNIAGVLRRDNRRGELYIGRLNVFQREGSLMYQREDALRHMVRYRQLQKRR